MATGSGRQGIGAYVNLAAYYLFGIPTAVVLGFRFKMRGSGLWIGITVWSSVQAVLLSLIITVTNWKQQVSESRQVIRLLICCFHTFNDCESTTMISQCTRVT